MRRTLTTALIAVGAWLALAGPAQADTFIVTGTGDATARAGVHADPARAASVPDAPERSERGVRRRRPHAIGLPTGTIQLTEGQLIVDTDMTIAGNGARATTVDAGQNSRVFMIAGGASVSMANFTIANGNVNNEDGGNFLVTSNSGVLLRGCG